MTVTSDWFYRFVMNLISRFFYKEVLAKYLIGLALVYFLCRFLIGIVFHQGEKMDKIVLGSTMEKVEAILRENEAARDSDKALWLIFIYKHNNPYGIEMEKLAGLLSESPSFETITRARRKVQENSVDLRGVNYQERIKRSFDVAKFLKEF